MSDPRDAVPPGRPDPVARDSRRTGEDGFVLITILGTLLILALIAASVLLASRAQLKVRASNATHAQLSAIADGVVRLAALRLTAPVLVARPSTILNDGTPSWCTDGTTHVELSINDAAGLIDINLAPVEILEILFVGLGQPRTEARALAAAVVDFRDSDDAPGPHGAESREYQQAGRKHGPKNGLFDSVEELDQVLGMTPAMLDRLRPLVTVHSKSPAVDIAVSPLSLLQALTLGNPARGVQFNNRLPVNRADFQIPAQLQTRANPRAPGRGRTRAFIIRATARQGVAQAYVRQAVVEAMSAADVGYIVHQWTSPPVGPVAASAAHETSVACFATP